MSLQRKKQPVEIYFRRFSVTSWTGITGPCGNTERIPRPEGVGDGPGERTFVMTLVQVDIPEPVLFRKHH